MMVRPKFIHRFIGEDFKEDELMSIFSFSSNIWRACGEWFSIFTKKIETMKRMIDQCDHCVVVCRWNLLNPNRSFNFIHQIHFLKSSFSSSTCEGYKVCNTHIVSPDQWIAVESKTSRITCNDQCLMDYPFAFHNYLLKSTPIDYSFFFDENRWLLISNHSCCAFLFWGQREREERKGETRVFCVALNEETWKMCDLTNVKCFVLAIFSVFFIHKINQFDSKCGEKARRGCVWCTLYRYWKLMPNVKGQTMFAPLHHWILHCIWPGM